MARRYAWGVYERFIPSKMKRTRGDISKGSPNIAQTFLTPLSVLDTDSEEVVAPNSRTNSMMSRSVGASARTDGWWRVNSSQSRVAAA